MSVDTPLWTPTKERIERSHMQRFMRLAAERHGFAADWPALRRWSIERRDLFWSELLQFAEVQPSAPAVRTTSGDGMLGTRWFEGMRLNYARHMLRFDDAQPALIFEDERGGQRSLTHRALRDEVARCAAAMRADGLRCGERVAGFMPNVPETVIAMLAAASCGAIWSSCSPDFGVGGVLDRFGQIEPTILVTTDGYTYGGKRVDSLTRVREMLTRLPSVRRLVVVPYVEPQPALPTGTSAVAWREYLGREDESAPALRFEEVPFDHPLFIMYSSGTTGVPKCIVHGHGGTLLQHMKELMLHTDLHAGERSFYFTTCGWMMWNWLVSGLGTGAAVVLYEGNPAHPTVQRLWELAERQRVTMFGTSPKFLAACEKAGIHPGREHDLSALRTLCSTGSPLAPEQFAWVTQRVGEQVQVASICGGTDIISCFMLGNPLLPVYAGEIQCCGLGMDVQTWSDDGRSVVGEKAELVCASPFPSQPVCFWNDGDGRKYRAAYFSHEWNVPRGAPQPATVWRHGDFVEITARGGVIVYGRSDATLNPGGVRIGTAEIYRVVEGISEVVDSVVVGRDADNDVEIVLFVVLRAGLSLTPELEQRIRNEIAAGATRRHVPRHIRQVADVPRTISGKKVELAILQALRGEVVKNRDALANPEALDQFAGIHF
ncbi:MAG: Acetyl-coenzyme A synthetase [Phycisphaerae bacterium]|nr:Acetyl-coenzyme A synthetase [Phycisphaerae bacterium]